MYVLNGWPQTNVVEGLTPSGLIQKAMNFNDVAIVSVKGRDYRIQFWYISKNDAINIIKNSNLNEKSGSL